MHGPKQMIVPTADLLQKWIKCVEGLIEFLLYWNEWRKNDIMRLIKKRNNDCFWMENIFCLESHTHLCSCHTSANTAYVIKTCLSWHAISKARYWGKSCMSKHIGTNNIVGGSIKFCCKINLFSRWQDNVMATTLFIWWFLEPDTGPR